MSKLPEDVERKLWEIAERWHGRYAAGEDHGDLREAFALGREVERAEIEQAHVEKLERFVKSQETVADKVEAFATEFGLADDTIAQLRAQVAEAGLALNDWIDRAGHAESLAAKRGEALAKLVRIYEAEWDAEGEVWERPLWLRAALTPEEGSR